MAVITGDNVNDLQHYGQYGNEEIADGGKTLAAAAIADTVDLLRIDGPIRFEDLHLINAALGAATTISIGWRYQDGSAGGSNVAMLAAVATNAAARSNSLVPPFNTNKAIVVYATVAGGVATGRIDIVLRYKALGGK